jgi:hypothetical protein
MVQLAGRTRETMQEFLRRATERKIDRLAQRITESFRFLLRKQTLVERIAIDPATFAITLNDSTGQALRRERLSEGEKQIFGAKKGDAIRSLPSSPESAADAARLSRAPDGRYLIPGPAFPASNRGSKACGPDVVVHRPESWPNARAH